MKTKFLKFVPPIIIGGILLFITLFGILGCEKRRDCSHATSSSSACVDCLNDNGGCFKGYSFTQNEECTCL